MIPSELLAVPADSSLVRCAHDDELIAIFIAMAASTAPCPDCGNDFSAFIAVTRAGLLTSLASALQSDWN